MFRDYEHRGDVFAAAVRAAGGAHDTSMLARLQRAGARVSTAALALGGAAPARDRAGDGLFGVDRDRRGEPLHRRTSPCVFPRAPRAVPRRRRCRRGSRSSWCRCGSGSSAAPWLFLVGAALLVLVLMPGIGREVNGSRRWLAARRLQPAALGADEARSSVLYAADYTVRKAAVHGRASSGFLPMFARDAARRRGCCCASPTSARFVVIAVIAFGVLFLGGMNGRCSRRSSAARDRLRGADRLLALSDAAHPRLHGSVGRSVRQGLPALARADRVRPRRMARRGTGRQRREAATICPRRTPISCSR